MSARHIALFIAAIAILPGCATISGSEIQNVALQSKSEKDEPLEKVACRLKNDKGTWEATAPGFVGVQRSSEDLVVDCKKDGHQDGQVRAISRAGGGMFGNILFGGGIGAIIDHNRGTGYNYPDSILIVMGKSTTIDRNDQEQAKPQENAQSPGANQGELTSGIPK